jgi:hypothetical protein
MMAWGRTFAQYHGAVAAAGETALGDEVGPDEQRHSTNEMQSPSRRQQQQQAYDGTGRAVMNGQQAVRRNSGGQGSAHEEYSNNLSYNDSTSQRQPQHQQAEIVPFLTKAQIREMSVRIKNATGDEVASRSIVQRLADAEVGVRITESLEGVEVYVDALTEEVKTSRDSDERERECFLYRDKQGRLFNLVVAVRLLVVVVPLDDWFFFAVLFFCSKRLHIIPFTSLITTREGQKKWRSRGKYRTALTPAGWHVRRCPSWGGCWRISFTWDHQMVVM